MAYKVIILYRLYMPSYFLGTFAEYPFLCPSNHFSIFHKTQGRFQLNASTFHVKRLCVLIKTYLHFSSNTSMFFQASSRTKK